MEPLQLQARWRTDQIHVAGVQDLKAKLLEPRLGVPRVHIQLTKRKEVSKSYMLRGTVLSNIDRPTNTTVCGKFINISSLFRSRINSFYLTLTLILSVVKLVNKGLVRPREMGKMKKR